MIQLRCFQGENVGDISGHMRARRRRVLYVLPTGGGKTIVFCFIVSETIKNGYQVRVIVHRYELLRQVQESLAMFGIPSLVCCRDEGWQQAPVQVGMVQTLDRYLLAGGILPPVKLAVWDEAHHSAAPQWERVYAAPAKYHLGVTATPIAANGKGLDAYFDVMVCGPSGRWLTDRGYLAEIDAEEDPRGRVTGVRMMDKALGIEPVRAALAKLAKHSIDVHKKDIGPGYTTLGFAASRMAGQVMADYFNEAGIRSALIDGTMHPVKVRQPLLDAYSRGEIEVLWSADLVDEGVNLPETKGIIITDTLGDDSVRKWLQRNGRGMRPKADGGKMVLRDMAGNIKNLLLPTDYKSWSMNGKPTMEEKPPTQVTVLPMIKRGKPTVKTSGQMRKVAAKLSDARCWKDARRMIERPGDLRIVKQYCITPSGKPYSWGWLMSKAASVLGPKLWPEKEWPQWLELTARGCGKYRYYEHAVLAGARWTYEERQTNAA